jgi:hypothetical protein
MNVLLASRALDAMFIFSWRLNLDYAILYLFNVIDFSIVISWFQVNKNRLRASLLCLCLALIMFLTLCPRVFSSSIIVVMSVE